MLISGKEIAKEIKNELQEKVNTLLEKKVSFPTLAIVRVDGDSASEVYARSKQKAALEIGLYPLILPLVECDALEEQLLAVIENLNNDNNVHGIIVELPLPKYINEKKILNAIDPKKDVDCVTTLNIGKMVIGEDGFVPCTAKSVVELLKRSNIEISGKHCVIVGRSNIVGKPLSLLMLRENATVTVCHSKTKDLKEICKNADILVSAIGKAKFITDEFVKNGAIVVDVGINVDENGKLCGDVDFESVKDKVSKITPVPGGVGPMTVAMLLKNTVENLENSMRN